MDLAGLAARLLDIPPETIALLPRGLAVRYRAIPLELQRKRLCLVMADPADLAALDEIAFITGYVIKPLVAPEVRLMQALARYYQVELDARYQQIIDQIDAPRPAEALPAAEEEKFEALEEAELVDEAEWSRQIEHYGIDTLSQELAAAGDREAIAAALIRYFSEAYDCAALFLVRHDLATGWMGRCGGRVLDDLPRITIPLGQPSVLKAVSSGGGSYLGPLEKTPLNARLLSGIGGQTPDAVLVLPLHLAGRLVAILYLSSASRPLQEGVVEAQRLLAKAAMAFEVLILRDKILMS